MPLDCILSSRKTISSMSKKFSRLAHGEEGVEGVRGGAGVAIHFSLMILKSRLFYNFELTVTSAFVS